MKDLYLLIGGFCIRISFHRAEKTFFLHVLSDQIKTYDKGFLIKKDQQAVDYTITICSYKDFEILRKKNDARNRNFINFFEKSRAKKITTYDHIGIGQFQFMLKDVVLELLSKHKGFLLHGSASQMDDGAVVFLGDSGAGKSTAMTLLNSRHPSLGDDSIIIKKEGSNFNAYQTPLIEKNAWVKKGSTSYPLKRLFFLRKADDFKIEKIANKNYILNRLYRQIWTEKNYWRKQIRYFLQFMNKHDFYFLYFKKDEKGMIDFLEKVMKENS